jgi:hypothetical protein
MPTDHLPGPALGRRPVQAWLALLLVAIVTALSWYAGSPPAPRPADAPPDGFAAARAVGSPVRDEVAAALRNAGVASQVVAGRGVATGPGGVSVGTVYDLVATVPGRASTGRVLLTAPLGSADAAALAEVARAFAAGPGPRNDVAFVFTDGADGGPVGVAAAISAAPGPGVLVDAAGPVAATPGAVVATTPGAGVLMGALDGPLGSSIGPATEAFLPDRASRPYLGVLETADRAGWAGIALGTGRGPADLQQHGDTLLATARTLGDQDVAALSQRSMLTFLTVFGLLVAWGDGWLVALTLASVVVLFALAAVIVRRRASTAWRLVGGVLAALVALLLGQAAGSAVVGVLASARPGFLAADPDGIGLLRAGVGVLAAAVVLIGVGLLRGRSSGVPPAFGALAWLTALGVVLAGLVPGAAFAATLPALLGSAGLIALLVIPARRPQLRLAVAGGAAVLVALVLLGVGVEVLAAGIAQAALTALMVVAFGLVSAPIVVAAVGRRRRLLPLLAVLVAAALVVGGLQVARFDAAHPQPTALTYVADASAGTTRWVSSDRSPPVWTRTYTPQPAAAVPPLPYGPTPLWAGPAQPAQLPAPDATVVTNGSTVTVSVRTNRAAPLLTLDVDRAVTGAAVDGQAVPVVASGDPSWPFRLQLVSPPPEGSRVELTVADPAGLRISVADATRGLEQIPGWTPPPPDVTTADRSDAGLVVVSRLVG